MPGQLQYVDRTIKHQRQHFAVIGQYPVRQTELSCVIAMAELSTTRLNWWTSLFFAVLVNLLTHKASGLLIVKPQDTYVLAGQVATLNCSTSSAEDVHWYYGTTYVYAGKKLLHPYLEKFKVEVYQHYSSTEYNLVFLAAKSEDAGTYNCLDDQGRGDKSSADITVLAADGNGTCQSNMKQDGVVIPNDCNIDPDEVQFSCSVTFNGKNPPKLEWKKILDNGDSVAKTECQTANNRVTCKASVTGDRQMNQSYYECHTTGSSQLSIKLCTIEVKNLIYASSATITKKSSVGTEVQCNPYTSQTCHYKWKYEEFVASTIRSMTPDKTGHYQCEAECHIRGKRCIVFDYAYISQSDDSTSCSTGCVLAICLAIFVLILTFIFLLLLKKERSKNQQLSRVLEVCYSKENGTQQERVCLMQPSEEMKAAKGDLEGYSKENRTQQELGHLMQPSMKAAKDEPILFRTLKPDAEHKGKAVFGLTILDNELYVLILGCPEIEVFDLQKLEFKRKCSLKGYTLETPFDIQANSKFKCLYVVDEKRDKEQSADIIKIDPFGKFQHNWPANGKNCRLSITRESNVIVTSHNNAPRVNEYSPDGILVCEIELKAEVGIVHPWTTLKRDKDEYIVSHGNCGDSQHRVCVIDRGGNLKYHFGGWKGSSNKQLYVPVHMAAYSNGHILVAEKDNGRLVLLSAKLEFIETFFSQCLRFPNRICLDEQNKRLFVSDNQYISNLEPYTDGSVLVYDMSSLQNNLQKHSTDISVATSPGMGGSLPDFNTISRLP